MNLLNILSLDVAAGAVICCHFFAQVMHVHIDVMVYFSLGLTVWIVYTADHLLDGWQTHHPASTDRHRFHQEHSRLLVGAILLASIANLVCISFLRRPILEAGIILGVGVLIYTIIQKQLYNFKELVATILYSSGILLPSLSLVGFHTTLSIKVMVLQFALIVLCNMILFSWYDGERDRVDGQRSFATVMGGKVTFVFLVFIFSIGGIIGIGHLLLFSQDVGPSIILFVMNLLLLPVFLFRRKFESTGMYRMIGDAIFLFPLASILS